MRRRSARLREAGAVILGKTTTPEFGCKGETNSPLTGITRNPWNPAQDAGRLVGRHRGARSPAGMGPLSVGTDGAGSVRIPAGVLRQLRPEAELRPRAGVSALADGHASPTSARTRMSVADAALMMNVLKRPDARDWTSLPYDPTATTCIGLDDGIRGLRIAFSPTLGYAKNVASGGRRRGRRRGRDAGGARRARRARSIPASTIRSRSRPASGSPARDAIWSGLDAGAAGRRRSRLSRRGRARRALQRARRPAPAPAPRRARLAPAPVHAALGPDRDADGRRAGVRRTPGRPQRR